MKKRRRYIFSSTGICLGYKEESHRKFDFKTAGICILTVGCLIWAGWSIANADFPTMSPHLVGEIPTLTR